MGGNGLTPWQYVATSVLNAAARSFENFQLMRYRLNVTDQQFPPGPWRDMWVALDTHWQTNRILTVPMLVSVLAPRGVSDQWISELWTPSPLPLEAVSDQVILLRERAMAAQQIVALDQARDVLSHEPDREARITAVRRLIGALEATEDQPLEEGTADVITGSTETWLTGQTVPSIETGVGWIDDQTNGFQAGEIWWIAGAYKMRKSSLMRHIALSMAQAGHSVTLCALEGSRGTLIAQFVAMMAAQWMMKEGIFSQNDARGRPLNALSSRVLQTYRGQYTQTLDKRQVAAIVAAIDGFRALGKHLRIYTSKREHGGVSDIESVRLLARRDKHLYGVDVLMIDYLQLMDAHAITIYDRVAQTSIGLQRLAQTEQLALLVLAQRNEETVKLRRDDGYSPGVKGGGDPAATADYLFVTQYPFKYGDGSETRDRLGIECRLARHGEAGGSVDVAIHAASGLIIPDATLAAPVDFGPMDTVYRGGQ
jgi:hypothetical protein